MNGSRTWSRTWRRATPRARARRVQMLLVSGAVCTILACSHADEVGSADGPEGGSSGASFETSPIVFGAYDPPGTFFVTLASGTTTHINDNDSFRSNMLSPSRTRAAQVTDPALEQPPDSAVEVYEIARASLLARFPAPGALLGWAGDDTLVFAR